MVKLTESLAAQPQEIVIGATVSTTRYGSEILG
jgi:hypothetical protein